MVARWRQWRWCDWQAVRWHGEAMGWCDTLGMASGLGGGVIPQVSGLSGTIALARYGAAGGANGKGRALPRCSDAAYAAMQQCRRCRDASMPHSLPRCCNAACARYAAMPNFGYDGTVAPDKMP